MGFRKKSEPGLMFKERTATGTCNLYFVSRSKIRNLGAESKGKASRNCWMIHRLVGCLTLKCKMRRRSWLMIKKQWSTVRDCGNAEEIHGGDGFLVVTQKGQPAFGWIWVSGNSFHPAGNGSFGTIKTEHQKFSVDAGRSPAGVLGHHLEDQFPNFFRCRSSTHGLSSFRNHLPVPTESGAVPSDDGFGCDDEERLFPT